MHCEHGRRCISRSEGDGDPEPIITHFEGKRLNSPNDVAVAGDGAIWFTDPTFGLLMPNQGSLVEPELDHRSVYRFDPRSGELRRMADFEQPNGLAFSPDGRTLYVSDTSLSLNEIPGDQTGTLHQIEAFDVGDDGSLANRRFFCHTDHGYPDGFTVDPRGWVWTTAADGIHIVARRQDTARLHPDPHGLFQLHVRRQRYAPTVHRRHQPASGDRPRGMNGLTARRSAYCRAEVPSCSAQPRLDVVGNA